MEANNLGRVFMGRVENGLNDHNPDDRLSRLSNVRIMHLNLNVDPFVRTYYIIPKHHPINNERGLYKEFLFDVYPNQYETQQIAQYVRVVENWIVDNRETYLRFLFNTDIIAYYEVKGFVKRELRLEQIEQSEDPIVHSHFPGKGEPARELTRWKRFKLFFKFIFR